MKLVLLMELAIVLSSFSRCVHFFAKLSTWFREIAALVFAALSRRVGLNLQALPLLDIATGFRGRLAQNRTLVKIVLSPCRLQT